MRSILQNVLLKRYSDLFFHKNKNPQKSGMRFGFEHNDGWFSIIDALCETIIELDSEAQALQVKEKLGSLRFYCKANHQAVYDAIEVACAFSSRVSELTGEIGALVKADGWLAVRSKAEIAELQKKKPGPPVDATLNENQSPTPPLTLDDRLSFTKSEAIAALRYRHPNLLSRAKLIDFPPRLFDLIDCTLDSISHPRAGSESPSIILVERIVWNHLDGLLIVPSFISIRRYAVALSEEEANENGSGDFKNEDYPTLAETIASEADDSEAPPDRVRQITEELAARISAISSFATAMSRRIDPRTGSCGPVDDEARIIALHDSKLDAPDLLTPMSQTREILASFDSNCRIRPEVFCKEGLLPNLKTREYIARKLRSGKIRVVSPGIYCRSNFMFSPSMYYPASFQIAWALAKKNRWHLAVPIEISQFFMGKQSRMDMGKIRTFTFDQPTEQVYQIESPIIFQPSADHRLFELNAPSQTLFFHIQLHPNASEDELLADAKFAAASWLGEAQFKELIAQDLKAGRFHGRELFLANSILQAARMPTITEAHAPAGFDPSPYEAEATRVYGWKIVEDDQIGLHLRAKYIENHPHIRDGSSLAHSTALIWFDQKIGWARTRSRFYRLMDPAAKIYH